jgi:predicted ATPase/DNA-binding SARP family transcriptional activator
LSKMLEVKLLGKFDVRGDGKPITISSRPAQSLFAYLILSAGTSHRREKLAGLFWPESLEETARDNLRHALWRVRKTLESGSSTRFLHADDLTIKFESSSDYWLDVAELEKVGENASADELIAVLSQYQGELLPGFYDEWVMLEREHLASIFEHHMARLMSLLQEEKRWLDILEWGERWIKLGQKPEPAYRGLMTAHAAKGDMSKVAATYQRCAKSLKEYGVEPSEQTRALYERLKAGKENLETGPTVPVKEKRKELPITNLPVPITSFIGREKEIDEIIRLLGRHRLVTLTGPGGVGKTRLAIQSSNELLGEFKDGLWWVELAPLMDEALLPQAVAQVLGVRESPNQPLTELLKSFLRQKQLLLVLDNCEHLIAGCAQLAEGILSACPKLKVLATSREALGLTGEEVWSVPILSLPSLQRMSLSDLLMQYEGIRLFVERASAALSDFTLTERNASSVTQVCQRLDGMPLAIELAAARVRMMSVGEIAKHLDDRFNLLTAGSRTALPRHQTLRAAIDWSYDLLSQPEQIFFNRLSVFAGGLTLEAAEEVAAGGSVTKSQVLDLLGQLINKSLVIVEMRSEDDDFESRFGMLETIREYAREKLDESGETEQIRQRHRDFFIVLAEQAEPELRRTGQMVWLDRLEGEYDNLRSAWDCAIESDAKLASRLASALLDFWMMRGNPSEGREWLAQLLPQTAQWRQTAGRARVLSVAGRLSYFHRDIVSARQLLEEALAIAKALGDKKQMAFALNWLGYIANYRRDDQTAEAVAEEGLTIYQELQDPLGIVETTFALAMTSPGQYPEAEERCISSLAKLRELGDNFGVAYALNLLGELVRFRGDYERARQFYEENLEILRKLGSRATVPPMLNLAWVSLHRGDTRRAKALFEESWNRSSESGDKGTMTECLTGFAGVVVMVGKPEQAARLIGAAESLLRRIGWTMSAVDQKDYDHYVAVVRGQLDEAAFERARAEGRGMTLEQALEFALKESQV